MQSKKLKLSFSKGCTPEFYNSEEATNLGFELEADVQKLLAVQEQISFTDVSFRQALKIGEKVNWNFSIEANQIKSARFKKFIPQIFKEKNYTASLYEYQLKGVDWLRKNKKCILADDMGLGKTLQVIKACQAEIFDNKIENVFIFCPNSLIKNWQNELKKWFPLANFCVFSKGELSRQKTNFTFILTPYSQLENFSLEANQETVNNAISIFDEAHKLRNEGARVSKSSKALNISHKWLLTGTPLERDEKDLQTILEVLDPGRFVGNFKSDKFFIKSKLKNITLRRTKKDALKALPKLSRHIHYLDLSEQETINYTTILNSYRKVPSTDKIGILTSLMIAASTSPNVPSSKIAHAVTLIQKSIRKDEKTIIFSRFNAVLEKTSLQLTSQNIGNVLVNGKIPQVERDKLIEKFQNDKSSSVLVINLSIGSEGLTLTEANNVIFINEAWNPSMNRQAEDRVNRIGQHRPVNIHILRCKATIDINLELILQHKTGLETEYVDNLLNEVFLC